MALTYDDITVAGATREAITISGSGDTAVVIFKDYLTARDIEIFTLIEASEGADMQAKFEAYVLPNKRLASDVYAGYLKTVGTFNAAVDKRLAGSLAAAEVLQLQEDLATAQATIVDLQAQIDALENP